MKIITGGVGKVEVKQLLDSMIGPGDETIATSDMDAAMKLRSGQADFYLGSCHTGAGASLGVLVGLLGGKSCATFGRKIPTEDDVREKVSSGVRAFGFSIDQIPQVVPVIWKVIGESR